MRGVINNEMLMFSLNDANPNCNDNNEDFFVVLRPCLGRHSFPLMEFPHALIFFSSFSCLCE